MAYQIALALGIPVFAMKQIMPHDEYLKWVSYFKHKRPDVQEQQMAVLTTIVVNAMGGKSKAKITDFLISNVVEPKPKQLTAEMLRGVFSAT